MPTFYVENFGCRATQADGAAIARQFQERGLERASTPANAAIVVINSCTVTAAADQDARAAVRRLHRQNPGCRIIVTGCYAQRAPEEIAALPGVSQVIGNSHKHQLAEIVLTSRATAEDPGFVPLSSLTEDRELRTGNRELLALRPALPDGRLTNRDRIFVSDIFAHTELRAAPVFEAANERNRPNLKVQDGCDNRCSFCIIPSVRGLSRSLTLDEVVREVNVLVDAGYREVVISGINLGRWGRDLAWDGRPRPPRFEDLIRAILSQTSLEKLRISSVEPMDWSDELIALMASSPRLAKHAHVPLQSASDAVLRRMHRKYRPWHYREKIEKIRAAMPSAAIGADVMAGFPGETDAEFEATRRMIEDLPFTYLHVFTYSARPGTPAAAMRDQVPVQVARERNRILRDLAAQKKLAFMRSFLGKTVAAITLQTSASLCHSERSEEPMHCGAIPLPASASLCHSERSDGPMDSAALPLPASASLCHSARSEEPMHSAALPLQTSASLCHSERSEEPMHFGPRQKVSPGPDFVFTDALTDNYLKLRLAGHHQANRWLQAQVQQVADETLIGVADQEPPVGQAAVPAQLGAAFSR